MIRLAVDFGAKFADFVVWDDSAVRILKRPVTGDMAVDLTAGLDALNLDAAVLSELRVVTTAPINALLARMPVPVALLTTRGFADTLRLGRQNRVALYDPVARSPAPAFLVDPQDIHEVGGRLDAKGTVLTPLERADMDAAIAALRNRDIRSVAICLLFSHVNPAQELQLAEAIRSDLPDISISLSHQVDAGPREYERTVSVLTDAWLAARMDAPLHDVRAALRARGFVGELAFGDGRGVLVPDQAAGAHRAILLSGAPAAAAHAAADLSGEGGVIAADIGSLSADMSTAHAGQTRMADSCLLAGVPLREACTDIESVALGGARRVEEGPRGLRFAATGPLAAGPAEAPSLDDALAGLGRLPDAARWSAPFTPAAAVAFAAARMAYALTRYATRRNIDPGRVALAVMGGTGALLAADIAAAMGLDRVLLPRAPGASGAIGLMQAARRSEASARIDRPLPELTPEILGALLDQLEAECPGSGALVYSVTLAAQRQMHPMPLRLAARPESGDQIAQAFGAGFHDEFGIVPPGPGYLFSLSVHRDAVTLTPPMPDLPGIATTGLIATEAGAIWCPEGWTLRRKDMAYLLERSPS
ncbi:hydantoinase/oxoprolinase N-terminal domain-containing protein [Antarcticimicrobium sediminis]|uniref:Hydantoinase/oxoprolinase family protein n=1 Tax=Antarcticimicrobium sediminis TaxID=2546227 RepID=A0A4R5EVE5_9RHOB|nr:hydantoinase/oxoprolinase family protein [Antarcticimicrobium sediminis]TDE38851.1 hydantoinase/oxoprolinase family protein [Antarcticimicrobium sediminis]